MVCLILNIVLIITYILFICYATKKRKALDNNNDYTFISSYPKFYYKFGFVFLAITLILHILSIVFYAINHYDTMWILFAIGSSFGLIVIIYYYDLLLNYEAINGDYLYVKRFIKTKKIYIYDIEKIIFNGQLITVTNKNNKRLFIMDVNSVGTDKIIEYVDGKLKNVGKNLFMTDYKNFAMSTAELVEDAEAIYKKIGKEYKNLLPKKIRFTRIIACLLIVLITIINALLFIESKESGFIYLWVLSLICVLIFSSNFVSKYKKEKKTSSLNLGKKYYYRNKNVVGSSDYKYNVKRRNTTALSVICFLIAFMIGSICLFTSHTKESELILVSGTIEYTSFEKEEENQKIIIALKETDAEYIISGLSLRKLEKEAFLDEIKEGQLIYLNVDKEYKDKKGLIDKSKTKRTFVYEVYTQEYTYLAYEDYVVAAKKDEMLGLAFAGAFAFLGLSSLIYLLLIKITKDNFKIYEHINVYKK